MWEFKIKSIQFSVVAAYSPRGFLTWRIFQGTVDHQSVMLFLRNDLQDMLGEGDVVIADNASVHKTEETIRELSTITAGNYAFLPPYSPRLAPIEHGFANMWEEVRKHERDAEIDPIRVVNAAFYKYSVAGSHGHVAAGHFNPYYRNHEAWKMNVQFNDDDDSYADDMNNVNNLN